jgi:TRAP-type transport system periplasmic protein
MRARVAGARWRAAPAAAAAFALAQAARADPVTLKFSTTMPSVDPIIRDGVLPFLAAVEKESGGTVKIVSFTGGQLTPNPAKQLDAMLNGIDDITIIVASYIPQALPDSGLFELPDLTHNAEEAAYAGWKMYEAGLLRGSDKFHSLAVFANDPASIFTRRRVKTLDDLKGMKIRISGPVAAQLVMALGAAPVGMDATQVAEALSRGLYEGTLNAWAVISAYRAMPLVKSAFDMSLGVRQFFLAMNKDVYARLPPAAQHAFDARSGLALSIELAHLLQQEGEKDRAQMTASGELVRLTPDKTKELQAIDRPFIDKWVAATEDGAKKVAFLEAAVADYRTAH